MDNITITAKEESHFTPEQRAEIEKMIAEKLYEMWYRMLRTTTSPAVSPSTDGDHVHRRV